MVEGAQSPMTPDWYAGSRRITQLDVLGPEVLVALFR